jgi:hypothetical protein
MYKIEKDYGSNVNFYDERGTFNDPPPRGGKKILNNDFRNSSFVSNNTNNNADKSFGAIKKEKPVHFRKPVEGRKDAFQSQIKTLINSTNLRDDKQYTRKIPEGIRDAHQSQIKNLISMK